MLRRTLTESTQNLESNTVTRGGGAGMARKAAVIARMIARKTPREAHRSAFTLNLALKTFMPNRELSRSRRRQCTDKAGKQRIFHSRSKQKALRLSAPMKSSGRGITSLALARYC